MLNREYERYLRLLGVVPGPPNLETLRKVVRSHLAVVPFENISKLVRWQQSGQTGLPSLTEYLDQIERHRFGGTCYTNNYFLNRLLEVLGFEVTLCGADMNRPNVHIVNLVRCGGREYLVDVGYAAPFIQPLPRDLAEDVVVIHGADKYILRPQEDGGRSRLENYRDGVLRHGYLINPLPRKIEDFESVIADSFRPEATFRNTILVVRYEENRTWMVRNSDVEILTDNVTEKRQCRAVDELVDAIQQIFGMPPDLVRTAVSVCTFNGDPWG